MTPRKEWAILLTRRQSNGSPDRRFGRHGWVKTLFSGSTFPSAISIDRQGRILLRAR